MEKTMNINIAGQLFRIDEEAFRSLSRYLETISTRFSNEPGGEETISDIESRIAEIFGGGQEPPVLVSGEMVREMIEVMGAPEEYADETPGEAPPVERKPLYDPGSLMVRAGQALSACWKACTKIFSVLLRAAALVAGACLSVFGFLLLFAFVFLLFFSNSPMVTGLIEPDIVNLPMLLSIAMNAAFVRPVIILTAMVILIPLAALTYLGIKLIFRLAPISKPFKVIVFVAWLAALCALCVIIALQVTAYNQDTDIVEKAALDKPPRTLWIAPLKKIAERGYGESAALDGWIFWSKSVDGPLFGTADLDIFCSDTTTGWISVRRGSCGSSESGAWDNARAIDFSWKLSRDTLYLDEYYSLPAGASWHGADVSIDVALPAGTEIRPATGADLARWRFRRIDPATDRYRIREGGRDVLPEGVVSTRALSDTLRAQ